MKELDAARSYTFGPFVADSLVLRKIARTGNNQPRPDSVEKRVGAGLPGMVLPLNDNVAVQIQAVRQERAFGFKATVGHEQNRGRRWNEQLDDIRLVVRHGCGNYAWRKKNMPGDVARQTEIVSDGQIIRFYFALLK